MDIDKDAVRPPPATRRKRPSALKCVVVLCSLVGLLVVGAIVYFLGKGVHTVYDMARNPHQGMYLNATSTEPGILPFIGKDDTFDVYLTIWARVPDAEVQFTEEEEAAAKERFGASLDTVKKMTKQPERELLVNPTEVVVFSERMFEGVSRKDRNLHKDIEFEIPLDRYHDKLVFIHDIRAAAILIPRSGVLEKVQEISGWKPAGAESLGRLDDPTAQRLGISGVQRQALDAISISFGLVELHDRNYLNRTSDEEDGEHEYFGDTGGGDATSKQLMKEWSTYQPHFITKSHVYLMDESRPMNATKWEKKHNQTRENSCGQGLSLPPTRYLCSRDYNRHGEWEHKLTLDTPEGSEVRYGPYIDILHRMAGPKHLLPLPVQRGKPYEEALDKKTITVHHQFTFSSFSPGRKNLLDHFANPPEAAKNATEAQLIQAHSDWEQWNGVLGNRGKDTHPRTRFILAILDNFILGLPIALLTTLYWYTRTTTAGLDNPAMILLAGSILLQELVATYKGFRSETVTWEMFIFVTPLMGFDLAQVWWMLKLALPFEITWRGWRPDGLRRSHWSKRERATRRLEGRVPWAHRGILAVGLLTLIYTMFHYGFMLVHALVYLPDEFHDTRPSTLFMSIVHAAKYTALILQLAMNYHSHSFAGYYALEVYLVAIRRVVQLLEFWPWFIGRYEVRGGIGGVESIDILLEVAFLYQALTLPRVEQVSSEDDEE